MTVRIAPSILSADFGKLADDLAMCEAAGADWIHVDVMDGRFVPNLSYGIKIIETVQRYTPLPIDVHLMVVEPERYFGDYVKAGADVLTFHVEAAPHLDRQVHAIRELGCKAGVAINPGTPVESIREIAHLLDLVLVMTVNPGYGGQKFIDYSLDKIARTRALLSAVGNNAYLEVDGGISRDTINSCFRAGADTFVAGNAVFAAADPRIEIALLRGLCAVGV